MSAIVVAALVTAGIYALNLNNTFNSTEKIENPFPDEALRPEPVVPELGDAPQNILLLGSDTRGAIGTAVEDVDGSRSDTMMLVHIPGDRTGVQVMSFMRDLRVDIPGHGKAKLNAAMAWGGVSLLVQTLEGMVDARIDHIAIVDFEGFKGITDALGGITVDNPKAFTARDGSTFAQGAVTLNGDAALTYVRERYAFRDGDYQRVRNQQAFLKAIIAKTLSAETLTNPVRINELVNSTVPYLAVDTGLNSSYAVSLALAMPDVRLENMRFFTVPTLGTGMVGNQSVVHPDWDQIALLKAAFRSDTVAQYVVPVAPGS